MPHPAGKSALALAAGLVGIALAASPAALRAQDGAPSREVVQPLPQQGADQLSAALTKLAKDPKDVEALLAAGRAALKLGDIDAGIGFYQRAEALGTAGGRARAGLAAALVRKRDPLAALPLFREAEQMGADLGEFAGDCGLAYDLVGDNARAQEYYRAALARGEDDEVTRRLALSLAIAGDQNGSETVLLPLLQHRDLAAYRTRAFALAVLGKTDEAVAIAEAVMPPSLASRISPYLRYMPRLTRSQQAAAGNFGHFPQASEIGHDDPRIAEYAAKAGPSAPPQVASADSRLAPAGAPLGPSAASTQPAISAATSGSTKRSKRKPAAEPVTSPPATKVSKELPAIDTPPVAQPVVATAAPPPAPPKAQPAPAEAPKPPPPPPVKIAVEPAAQAAPVASGKGTFDLGRVSGSAAAPEPAQTPPPAVKPAASGPGFTSLEEAFAGHDTPLPPKGPAAGAVDITKIDPPREVEKKPEPPPKPKYPSRVWVQVATGKDRKALGFDWRRMTRKAKSEFKGKDGYFAKWGRTNRLVTGPFPNEAAAQAFVRELKKAGISSFIFTSDDGEKLDPLP